MINSRKITASYLANSGVASRHRQQERNVSIYIPANITLLLEQYLGSSHFYSPGATPGIRFQDICYCFYYFSITIAVVIIILKKGNNEGGKGWIKVVYVRKIITPHVRQMTSDP